MRTGSINRIASRSSEQALLTGLLFDSRGNRMTPSFSTKRGVRYRSYVSAALLHASTAGAGDPARVSAPDIEATIWTALRPGDQDANDQSAPSADWIAARIRRIDVGHDRLIITLQPHASQEPHGAEPPIPVSSADIVEIPWSKPKRRDLAQVQMTHTAPARPNPAPVQAVVRAHAWIEQLTAGRYQSIEALAKVVQLHPKVIRKTIRFAFLAPQFVEAIILGRYSSPIGLTDMYDELSLAWTDQRLAFQ